MKKSILSIFAVCAIVFSSCTDNPNTVGGEDKGTSTAIQSQNADVNPNHIRGYGEDSHTNNRNISANAERATDISGRMATDLQLDPATQRRVLQVLNKHERQIAELQNTYNYSETARMGGEANNDTRNDMSNNTSTIMEANRQNNAGNDYAGNEEMDRVGAENMRPSESNMNAERSQIMQETERELQQVLTPQQFNQFKQNRSSYFGNQSANSGSSNSQMNSDGGQSQNQTGNIQQEQKQQNQQQNQR